MNVANQHARMPALDDPWRRMPWIAIAAVLAWIAMLAGFAMLLEERSAALPRTPPIEARLVEIPAPVHGLQGSGAKAAAPARPAAHPAPVRRPVHRAAPRKFVPPPIPRSPEGAIKPAPASQPTASRESSAGAEHETSKGASAPPASSGASGAEGESGAGVGSDSGGARAIYAPVPEIPDDLRGEDIDTVAVAHFTVATDGTATVTLVTPTPNPRLNQILLDTLGQWRFFPAMQNGAAVESAFDVRIPIRVQ